VLERGRTSRQRAGWSLRFPPRSGPLSCPWARRISKSRRRGSGPELQPTDTHDPDRPWRREQVGMASRLTPRASTVRSIRLPKRGRRTLQTPEETSVGRQRAGDRPRHPRADASGVSAAPRPRERAPPGPLHGSARGRLPCRNDQDRARSTSRVEIRSPATWKLATLEVVTLSIEPAHDVTQTAPGIEISPEERDFR
jgi:hypothetical protein